MKFAKICSPFVRSSATAEKDLASATAIREKENADFTKVESELMEGVSMLERAIAIIEREMAKTGFIQGADSMKKVGPGREPWILIFGVAAKPVGALVCFEYFLIFSIVTQLLHLLKSLFNSLVLHFQRPVAGF